MDSEEEGVSADIIEDEEEEEEEEEEEIGVDDGGEVFPTVDRVFKETEVVDEDDFHFEVITADDIVHHMVQCIKDVNTVVQDNEKDLENAMEQLSKYLERDITSEILVGLKRKVQNKTRYCESRRQVVLDHVHEGYDKDLWEYQKTV